MAMRTFEMHNAVQEVPAADAIYKYNAEEQRAINEAEPWTKE